MTGRVLVDTDVFSYLMGERPEALAFYPLLTDKRFAFRSSQLASCLSARTKRIGARNVSGIFANLLRERRLYPMMKECRNATG